MNKSTTRVVLGILGAIGVFLGIRQVLSGLGERTGRTVPQKIGEMVAMPAHGCSMRVPEGWERKEADGGATMFSAPTSSGYAGNLVVTSASFSGSLREYADLTIKLLNEMAPDAQVKGDMAFEPTAGPAGVKLGLRRKLKDLEMVQTLYLLGGRPGQRIAITASAPAEQSGELEPLFEACLKSFDVLP